MCNKYFAHRSALNDHRKAIHNKEQEFRCDQCGKRFRCENEMKVHFIAIHTDQTFDCETCGIMGY